MLARTQSQLVADALTARHPGLRVELRIFKTTGDRITERPLHEFGGKGLFTKELEQALLDGGIDFAVHSFKDVPVTMPLVDTTDLVVAAVPEREDPRDVLVSRVARRIKDLPPGSRVGTGSLRRRCQLLAARPDLVVEPIRGNIDTRIGKLRDGGRGEYDAVILAMAGVKRAGLFDESLMEPVPLAAMLCAPGQGRWRVQCRRDDARTRNLLAALNDADTAAGVEAERAVVLGLDGDCHSPIAARAVVAGECLALRAVVGARDGDPPLVAAAASSPKSQPRTAVDKVLVALKAQGVEAMLGEGSRLGGAGPARVSGRRLSG